jgi:hypothetical protein
VAGAGQAAAGKGARGTQVARSGVDLERSTLADWVGASSALLSPLVERLAQYVMGASKLHADDTPVPVLCPGRGTTKTGRLWTYVRDDRAAASMEPPAVVFYYSPDRKGERPRQHLAPFRGTLQADGYAGFDRLYGERIQEAACWAHVRRKFYDLHLSTNSPLAREALEKIGELYGIEESIRGRCAEERRAERQARAGVACRRARSQELSLRRIRCGWRARRRDLQPHRHREAPRHRP